MKSLCALLAASALCSFGSAMPRARSSASPLLLPGALRQGGFLLLQLPSLPAGSEIACRWLEKDYPCFPIGAGFRALLPVKLETEARSYVLLITIREPGESARTQQVRVKVAPGRFGVQRLRLKAKQEALYSDPSVEREYRLIHDAFAGTSQEQLWQGNFLLPVRGRITTSFGLKRFVNGRLTYRHRGLDLSAPMGKPVLAANAGEVRLAAEDFELHGKTVVIDHGQGVSTLYLHLSEILVREGEQVARGQEIARVGATGIATGPHLHFGTYLWGVAVDPSLFRQLPAAAR